MSSEYEVIAKFAREKLHLKSIPADRWDLVMLVYEHFLAIRHEYDSLPMRGDKTSHPDLIRDLFIDLYHVAPNAKSFLELGVGTGYVLRAALSLGYDAVGVEVVDEYVNDARKILSDRGNDPKKVIKADFLDDDFANRSLDGKQVKDFDVIHIWTLDDITFKATPRIVPHMKQGSYLLIGGFDQPFGNDDVNDDLISYNIPARVEHSCRGQFFLRRS
ncbi:MAG: class I SAM-dependent methyltransferase [archaeon]